MHIRSLAAAYASTNRRLRGKGNSQDQILPARGIRLAELSPLLPTQKTWKDHYLKPETVSTGCSKECMPGKTHHRTCRQNRRRSPPNSTLWNRRTRSLSPTEPFLPEPTTSS